MTRWDGTARGAGEGGSRADKPTADGKRPSVGAHPIDPLTRVVPADPFEEPIDEIPTDTSGPSQPGRAGPMAAVLGDAERYDEEEPFRDEPTIDNDATPDEPTWRDAGVVPLPQVDMAREGAAPPPRQGSGPLIQTASGVKVRVPSQPVKERRRPTGPVDLRSSPPDPSARPAYTETDPVGPGRARRRRATSYQGVAAKPGARQRRILRTVTVISVSIVLAVAAIALLLSL